MTINRHPFCYLLTFLISTTIYGQQHGLVIETPFASGNNGIQLEFASNIGIRIKQTRGTGLFIDDADGDGVRVDNAQMIGMMINRSNGDGFHVASAGDDGFHVASVADDGFQVDNAGGDGVLVVNAGSNGLNVQFARNDGIRVDSANGFSMNIQGDRSIAGFDGHIAQVYNRNVGSSPDVLALRVGTSSDPGGGSNYITFYHGTGLNPIANGRIEGNGNGGVVYATTGADFAEALPRGSTHDNIEGGDIIGVADGVISHNTTTAIQVMAITDRPAVLGNQGDEESTIDEMVSFIGQIPIKVLGPVVQGDWIVPSGLHDGIGRAVSSRDLTLEHRIVGRAWESNSDPNVKRVNCVVGLDQSEAKDAILQNMHGQMQDMQAQIEELKALVLKD